MTRRKAYLAAALAAVLLLAVYSRARPAREPAPEVEFPEPQWDTLLGSWDRGAVAIPDSMRVGIPAMIRITTNNSDTCIQSVGTEVRVDDLVAIIHPRDIVGHSLPCGTEVTEVVHDTTITFRRPGMATVRVERRDGEPLERQVVVY